MLLYLLIMCCVFNLCIYYFMLESFTQYACTDLLYNERWQLLLEVIQQHVWILLIWLSKKSCGNEDKNFVWSINNIAFCFKTVFVKNGGFDFCYVPYMCNDEFWSCFLFIDSFMLFNSNNSMLFITGIVQTMICVKLARRHRKVFMTQSIYFWCWSIP